MSKILTSIFPFSEICQLLTTASGNCISVRTLKSANTAATVAVTVLCFYISEGIFSLHLTALICNIKCRLSGTLTVLEVREIK